MRGCLEKNKLIKNGNFRECVKRCAELEYKGMKQSTKVINEKMLCFGKVGFYP